jgi:hypothetical protein
MLINAWQLEAESQGPALRIFHVEDEQPLLPLTLRPQYAVILTSAGAVRHSIIPYFPLHIPHVVMFWE